VFSLPAMCQDGELKRFDHIGLFIKYGYDLPFADLADRFGQNNEAGFGIEKYVASTNLIASAEFNFLFGNKVKQDVLSDLRLENGNILAVSGRYGSVFLRERGNYVGLMIEKIMGNDIYGKGLRLGIGFGILSHKIRVQNDTNDVPQVRGDYERLYDHKSRGVSLKERVSYSFANKTRRSLFSVGLEFTQGFTSNIRAINSGTDARLGDSTLDLMIGLNVKWTIPLSNTKSSEEIYY